MASYGAQSLPPHKKQDSTTQDEQSRSERVVGDVVIYSSEADGDAEQQKEVLLITVAEIIVRLACLPPHK
jgi:hypothetical protein